MIDGEARACCSPRSIDVRARKGVGVTSSFAVVDLVRPEHEKPLRDLIVRLPQLVTDKQGKLDLLASSPSLVLEIAERAETSVKAITLGIGAVSNLIPFAAPEIEDGTVPMGTVEALGWLLSELGELAATCMVLAAECRQARNTPENS
jgi:hypothetical protein